MNIAIIGANGFIGSHLSKVLSKDPRLNLFFFGRSSENNLSSETNYHGINHLHLQKYTTLFSEIDLVYYLASSSIPASSWDNPQEEIEINLKPFLDYLDFFTLCKIKKLVFVSSAGTVYGPSKVKVKEDADKHPFSPHGIVKLAMENFLEYHRRKSNLQYDIYRVSNVFGEGQNTKKGLGLINTLLENCIVNRKVTVFGNGENLRNYVYVKDLVQLMQHSIKAEIKESSIFNLASNDSYTINQIIEALKEIVEEDFEVVYQSNRKSDNEFIDIDNSKILLSYPDFQFTDFKQAIKNTYDHIKSVLQT